MGVPVIGWFRRARAGIAGPVVFLAAWSFPTSMLHVSPVAAQARRQAVVQPVPEVRRGDLLLGVGVHRGFDATFPLGDLSGDLWSWGRLTLAYGLADRVLLEIEGDAWRVLSIERRGAAAIPLDPGVDDGTTSDAGDFEIAVGFMPIGGPRGLSGGARIGVRLPNSDERKGIGTNTTDVGLAGLLSWGAQAWRLTGRLGVGILEAPLDRFEQNDVLEYGFEATIDIAPRARAALGVEGRASTRDVVPLGTEDLAELRATLDWRARGAWGVDLAISRGLAGSRADWSVGAGVSWARPPR